MTMEWARIYPDLGTVMRAPVQTLQAWDDHLPPPQTDVERTIRRRLRHRLDTLYAEQLEREHPELAGKLADVLSRLDAHVERVLGRGRA